MNDCGDAGFSADHRVAAVLEELARLRAQLVPVTKSDAFPVRALMFARQRVGIITLEDR